MAHDFRSGTSTTRLHALDALRGFALLSGVALHATLAFLPNVQLWIIREQPSLPLALLFYTVHMFRMPVFFLLAGYFARHLLARKGTAGFVRDRLFRIGLPFLVFYPIVGAVTIACAVWAMRTTGQRFVAGGGAGAARPRLSLDMVPLTHLWFLYVLLILYACVLLARTLVSSVDRDRRRADPALDRLARSLTATPLLSFLLASPLACAFLLTPAWRAWLGITPPAFGLVPNGAALVGYGTAFCLGWLLCRQPFLLERLAGCWRLQIGLALVATIYCIVEIGRHPSMEFTPHSARLAVYAGVYALGIWAWTLALTGVAVRFLADERPLLCYVADSSYWIYIVHIPVLAALQPLVVGLAWPPFAKYALLLVGLAILLPLSYELLVRHSFLGQWLNGRRYPLRGGASARTAARWKAGAIGVAAVGLALLIFLPRAGLPTGEENGRFANDCCGTLELRDGGMLLNDKQAIPYKVGRDARGPYILPRAYVGGFEQVGFEIDGTRQPTKLRLDRLPNPTRILLYDGSKPSIFERKARPRDGG